MSIIKEVGVPKRPPQGRTDEGWALSERVPPPRSSSPVIGSPPVRAVPIGTPPKQPMSHALNHQVSLPPPHKKKKATGALNIEVNIIYHWIRRGYTLPLELATY